MSGGYWPFKLNRVGEASMDIKFRTTSGAIVNANPLAETHTQVSLAVPAAESGEGHVEPSHLLRKHIERVYREIPRGDTTCMLPKIQPIDIGPGSLGLIDLPVGHGAVTKLGYADDVSAAYVRLVAFVEMKRRGVRFLPAQVIKRAVRKDKGICGYSADTRQGTAP
ncbi:hypothetical protein AX279_17840 [Pseudomonas sp. J237]|nr:hypothetical protein AX279_17840 [Pseudomonas sp. J237]